MDENIVKLPVKPKTPPAGDLTVVSTYGTCPHAKFLVDERAAEVTCRDCREKLNPIWVLGQLAQGDSALIRRWALLSAHVKLLEGRTKVKCRSCQKMVSIPTGVSDWKLLDLADRIRREEAL